MITNPKLLKRIIRIPYDAGADLDRIRPSLDFSLDTKPIFNFNDSSSEAVARVKN